MFCYSPLQRIGIIFCIAGYDRAMIYTLTNNPSFNKQSILNKFQQASVLCKVNKVSKMVSNIHGSNRLISYIQKFIAHLKRRRATAAGFEPTKEFPRGLHDDFKSAALTTRPDSRFADGGWEKLRNTYGVQMLFVPLHHVNRSAGCCESRCSANFRMQQVEDWLL